MLPQTAVRAIGASQVLTDPSAVVKELVDNALDARATNIAVEIHANTLDSIQVRDNGHGIPPQDRPLVARRYCTSKLTDADDLASIGGSSLGFRGEALASAAEMSSGMTITTRVEGEQVATSLKINQQGEVAAQVRASTQVGTTVKITDFIKSNPVRRQVALKHTDQCLKRIKHLLQAFAFARPHVRFHLRVSKAKNNKGDWTYAPKAGGNAEDAAFKIVGAACASQCTWSVIEEHGFTLQAFLPKPDAAAERLSNISSFVSVDRRPLTANRGFPKQVVKIFREALKKCDSRFEGIKDPFIFLDISCPEQSYDPNIEPAKDDVLFEDTDKVVDAARKLFAVAYPPCDVPPMNRIILQELEPALPGQEIALLEEEDDFITSLEQPRSIELNGGPGETDVAHNAQHDRPVSSLTDIRAPRAFRSNMYGCDEEDLNAMDARPSTGRTETDFEELRQARKDVSISNPWVMAKMNASNRQPGNGEPEVASVSNAVPDHEKSQTPLRAHQGAPPTPRASSPTSPAQPFNPSDHVPGFRLANDGRVIEPPSSQDRSFVTPGQITGAAGAVVTPSPSQQRSRPAYNYGLAPQIDEPQGTPLSAIPQAKPRTKAAGSSKALVNRPFVSPVVDGPQKEKVWFDHLEGIEERGRQRPRRRQHEAASSGLVQQGELEEPPRPLTPPRRNRDIRDFVASVDLTEEDSITPTAGDARNRRNRRSITADTTRETIPDQDENAPNNYGALSGRGFVPASELAALEAHIGSIQKPMAPPPKRRKTADRVLRQISGNAPAPAPAAEDEEETNDDKAYRPEATTRRRSSAKVQRTKSSRLPLERIPASKGTQNLIAKLSLTSASIASQSQDLEPSYSIIGWNEPALDAYDTFAEEHSQDDVQIMSTKLRKLLISRVSDGEMVQDVGDLVKTALDKRAETMLTQDEFLTQSQEMLDVSQQ